MSGFLPQNLRLRKIDNVDYIALIHIIDLIKKIDLISSITSIDQLTNISNIEKIAVLESVKTIDKISEITNIARISAFGEVGTLTYIDETTTADILTPTAGYKIRLLGGCLYNETDVKAILRWKTSGNFVLGLPTIGLAGFNPFNLKHPLSAQDELLELYMSAAGVVKGWVITQEVKGTGTSHSKTVTELLGLLDTQLGDRSSASGEWVHPTGHIDPDSGWSSEPLAYDGFDFTSSNSSYIPTGEWTKFLYLTIAEITSNKLRYNVSERVGRFDIDVDVHVDDAWVHVYQGSAPYPHEYVEKSFAAGSVDQMRIRFYGKASYEYAAWIYEADFWKIT